MAMVSGRLVAVHGNTLVVAHDDGLEHEHATAPGVAVTRDGVVSSVEGLQVGDKLAFDDGDPVTSVRATSA
jgi:hypothetical protein